MNSKTNKNKLILDLYDPVIYPIKLAVAKNLDKNKLKKTFKDLTDEDMDNIGDAITIFTVRNRNDEYYCLVLLSDKTIKSKDKLDRLNTCSHEAGHYAIDLLNYVGLKITPGTSEAFTYLQSWATECIYKTLVK